MEYKNYKTYGKVIVAQRADYKWGVLDLEGNEIVPFGKYGWIDGFDQGLARVRTHGDSGRGINIVALLDIDTENKADTIEGKDKIEDYIKSDRGKHPDKYAKWGIINEEGEEVLPIEYDDVWNFLGKGRSSTKVVMNGETRVVFFHELNPDLPIRWGKSYDGSEEYDYDSYHRHYEEFAGTYAQDVMGYSDEDIYDAFDGDPDAYWNID